jgi:hypothetical protein
VIALAGAPDDDPGIESKLVAIAQLVADRVAPVDYASVTAHRDGAYTTVAASSDVAIAVDEAQYAEQSGPCLDVFDTRAPVAVPDIGATMTWPGFRDTAYRLGLRASLSIPLFAGRGTPVAALNLYGRDAVAMTVLTAVVWGAYQAPDATTADAAWNDLDAGSAELVAGLSGAFAGRAVIQQAIGVVMAGTHSTADAAYTALRLRAAATGRTLTDTAAAAVTTT